MRTGLLGNPEAVGIELYFTYPWYNTTEDKPPAHAKLRSAKPILLGVPSTDS